MTAVVAETAAQAVSKAVVPQRFSALLHRTAATAGTAALADTVAATEVPADAAELAAASRAT
jgi:hypothetical protein